tara:strand:+ start:9218 stop:10474 length:1257 start_codon:yes stop_codon:yes gene_type:complete
MKTTKFLGLLFLSVAFWSCSDDPAIIELSQPSFTVTVSPDNPSIYFFENTTPNKEEFYSYWEFDLAGIKGADKEGPVEYQYTSSGAKIVTLTMVSSTTALQTTQSITVTLPPPTDVRFLFNPENLLKNGYLVEGTGDDFTNWSKNNGAGNMTAETVDVLIGPRALKVSNAAAGNEWETQFVSDATPTVIDQAYTVSMWLKGDAAVVRVSTNPNVGNDQYGPNFTITSDWKQYKWTFNAKTATTLIALDMGKSAGNFKVDGIELVKGSEALPLPSNDSEVLNGGLENGTGNDFTNWGKNNGSDRFLQETTDVLGGKRALKVINPVAGNPWETQFVSDAFTTENGASYTASMWIKGTAVVRFSTNPNVGGDQYAGDYTATASWTKYSWTFTANSPTTLLALDMGKAAGTFFVDNIKVVKN